MSTAEDKGKQPRKYPPVYEKVIPIAIAVLAIIVVGVLMFTLGVGLGVVHGT